MRYSARYKHRTVSGGYRHPWQDYFGDPTVSAIKFALDETPDENETLRRATCASGHRHSVDAACPHCAREARARREGAWTSGAIGRVGR